MEKTNIIEKRMVGFLVLSILLIGLVSAYGVASPYWKGHALYIAPGDTKTVSITLQNMDEEDITVDVSLTKGSEIASVREGEYLVKSKTIDTEILVTVSIPEDVPLETLYEVTLSSSEVVSGDTGGVALGVAMVTTFDVLVASVPTTEEKETNLALIVILAIAILVIIILLIAIEKKRKAKKSK